MTLKSSVGEEHAKYESDIDQRPGLIRSVDFCFRKKTKLFVVRSSSYEIDQIRYNLGCQ